MSRVQFTFVVFLLAASLGGQQKVSAPALDESEIQKRMHDYLRDITELPLTVNSEVTVSDRSETTTEQKHSAHRLTYEAGSSPRKKAGVERIGESKAGSWEVHADVGVFATAYVFLPDQWSKAYEHSSSKREGDTVLITYRSREECSPWKKNWLGWHGFKFVEWCGAGELRLKADDLTPLEASFTGSQVAPDLGSSDAPSYLYTMTFQRVALPGNVNLFIVPRDVTLTVRYKEHRVVVHNSYSRAMGN